MGPQIDLARELLADVELLLAQGRYRSSASRAYYAAYHACVALMEHAGLRPNNYLGRGGRPASRWEHGIVTESVAQDPRLSRVLGRSVARQVRWQYLMRIRGDYRAHETVSALAARTSLHLARQIVGTIVEHVNAERS